MSSLSCQTDWQAADAVSAYTRVKMEDAPRLLRSPRSEYPDLWMRLPRHKWPKSWMNFEDPVVPLERNLYGHPLAGLLWETIWRNSITARMGESARLKMSFCFFENKDYSSQCMWTTSTLLERCRIWVQCGRHWWRMSIWMSQYHFLITCIWSVLNVNANQTQQLLDVNLEDSVNSKFSEPHIPNPSANLTYRRPELVNCTIEIWAMTDMLQSGGGPGGSAKVHERRWQRFIARVHG